MPTLFDRVKTTVSAAPGTGAIVLGAAVAGYRTPADAGAIAGVVVSYVIEDGTAWEIGHGAYGGGGTITRTTVIATSLGGTTPINASAAAVVFLSVLAADLLPVSSKPPGPYTGQFFKLGPITSNGSSFVSIAEMTFHDPQGGLLTPVGVSATSHLDTGENEAKILDGDPSTHWTGNNQDIVTFDFGHFVSVHTYTIQNGDSGVSLANAPASWNVVIGGAAGYKTAVTGQLSSSTATGVISTYTVPLDPNPASTAGGSGTTTWPPFLPPAATDYILAGDASVVNPTLSNDSDVGLVYFQQGYPGGDRWRGGVKTIPSPTAAWSMKCLMKVTNTPNTYATVGILLYNSTATDVVVIGHDVGFDTNAVKATRVGGQGYDGTFFNIGMGIRTDWWKFDFDGNTTLTISQSADGKLWTPIYTGNVNTDFGGLIDTIGFGAETNNGGSLVGLSVPYYVDTFSSSANPPAGA